MNTETKTRELLSCEKIPQIAVPFMNEVHCEEVGLVNELNALIEQSLAAGEVAQGVTEKLADWVAHTHAHFERENRLMAEHGFPPYAVHKGEHDAALEMLDEVQRQWLASGDLDALAHYVRAVWPDWFMRHVSSMDFVTAQFLSMKL